jgi:hypothetical protein
MDSNGSNLFITGLLCAFDEWFQLGALHAFVNFAKQLNQALCCMHTFKPRFALF